MHDFLNFNFSFNVKKHKKGPPQIIFFNHIQQQLNCVGPSIDMDRLFYVFSTGLSSNFALRIHYAIEDYSAQMIENKFAVLVSVSFALENKLKSRNLCSSSAYK